MANKNKNKTKQRKQKPEDSPSEGKDVEHLEFSYTANRLAYLLWETKVENTYS